MKKLKLFPKTFIYVTGLMLIITFIAHALIYYFMPIFYTNQKQDNIEKDTNALVELLSSLPPEDYKSNIQRFRKGSDMIVMLLVGENNKEVDWQIYSDDSVIEEADYFIPHSDDNISLGFQINGNHLVVERTFVGLQNRTCQLKTYLPLEPVQEASDVVLTLLPLTLVVCFAVSAVFALIYSKVITKPIRKISSVAQQMEQLERTAYCPIASNDEIGTLSENLNSLYGHLLSTIDQLEDEISEVSKSEQSKADFLRTASHELKTPVTAVSAMLEGMIYGVGRYRDRDTYLLECKKQIDDLGVLLREILEASKLDMYTEATARTCIDLELLLDSIIEPYKLIAKSNHTELIYLKEGSFAAILPERLFAKAVSNVISNAVNYTPSGRTVRIYFSKKDLIIENECTPMQKEVLAHLSEPFYRPDFDHSHDSGGNGLGLYITDKVLSACHIEYTFGPLEDNTGMRFIIHIP